MSHIYPISKFLLLEVSHSYPLPSNHVQLLFSLGEENGPENRVQIYNYSRGQWNIYHALLQRNTHVIPTISEIVELERQIEIITTNINKAARKTIPMITVDLQMHNPPVQKYPLQSST